MHICIDARLYGPLGKGLGRYTERLIQHLEMIDTENTYSVLLCRENYHLYLPKNERWTKHCVPVRWYTFREQWVVPRVLWRLKPDIVHFPHFNVPLLYRGKFVVTIHDLILLKHPSVRTTTLFAVFYWMKYFAYRLVLRHALHSANQVITVSHTVRHEIERLFPVTRFPLRVTYEASDGVEAGQLKMPEHHWLATHSITQPYLLYVGNAYPHKNLDFLINWFLTWQQRTSYQLVFVGTEDYFYKQLKVLVARYPSLVPSIIFFGYATESELADLYRNAAIVLYPSLEEGFGLPPLEAMRYDVPVVVSDLAILHEILGDAATYFNPHDARSLTNAVASLSVNERSRKIALGQLQVQKYSWRHMAEQTLEMYHTAGTGNH